MQCKAIQHTSAVAGDAVKMYRHAAKADNTEGLYSLGWMHATGLAVPRNSSQAAALYRQAIQKAPDWQHAAAPFIALLFLPSLVAMQWLRGRFPGLMALDTTGKRLLLLYRNLGIQCIQQWGSVMQCSVCFGGRRGGGGRQVTMHVKAMVSLSKFVCIAACACDTMSLLKLIVMGNG